ncbi:MAG: Gp15 family bacteriophage protein, partial [Agathobacter sp.]
MEDFGLIAASFRSQYGIRLSKESEEMPWDEFKDLLAGLNPDTPLGRIVQIRLEDDEDTLKHFSPEQHKIRNEWRNRTAKQRTEDEMNNFLASMQEVFK